MVHHLDVVAWCDVVIACYLNSNVNKSYCSCPDYINLFSFYCYKELYELHNKSVPDGANVNTKFAKTLVKFGMSLQSALG